MLRLRDVKEYLQKRGAQGATTEELEEYFVNLDASTKPEDVKRLLKSGLGFLEILAIKTSRGKIRYFHEEVRINEIVEADKKEAKAEPAKKEVKQKQQKKIDEIDLPENMTAQEKIEAIMASDTPITRILEFTYREALSHQVKDRALHNFLNDGFCEHTVKIMPSPTNSLKKVKVVSKRYSNNSIVIGRNFVGKWTIIKTDCKCPERKEVLEFDSYQELEKALRTLVR